MVCSRFVHGIVIAARGCEELIQAEIKSQKITGLSVAIGRHGHVSWTRGFGFADVENRVPATEHTVYRLASISKPITAVAAMQLAENGKLDLSAPIQQYVTTFPEKRWKLTARDLLSHLGGVRHYRAGEIYSRRHYARVADALEIFSSDKLLHRPGSKYAYTTYGYNLLGAAVASAAGQTFVAYLKKHVFAKAGMRHTYEDDLFAIIPNRAEGYRRGPRGSLRNSHIVDTSNKIPGGGLCGTASDLVRFSIALTSGRFLKKSTVDRMWTEVPTAGGTSTGYGLGFRIYKADKPRIVGHTGSQPRVRTMLLIHPDEGVIVALMCNQEGTRLPPLAKRLAATVLAAR